MQKAQGSLEYLLLLGGGLAVAVVSITVLFNIISSSQEETIILGASALCAKFPEGECDSHTIESAGQSVLCYAIGPNACRAGIGLSAAWNLNSGALGNSATIYDQTPNGNNGTIFGDVDCTQPGIFGGTACFFDGVDDYIDFGDPNIAEGLNSLSVTAWIKNAEIAPPAEDMFIVNQDGPGGDTFRLIRKKNNNAFQFRVEVASGDKGKATTSTIVADTDWHHLAGVYDGSNVRIYLDGLEDDSAPGPLTGSTTGSTATIRIGGKSTGGKFYKGTIDEVTIWKRALSASEIKLLFERG